MEDKKKKKKGRPVKALEFWVKGYEDKVYKVDSFKGACEIIRNIFNNPELEDRHLYPLIQYSIYIPTRYVYDHLKFRYAEGIDTHKFKQKMNVAPEVLSKRLESNQLAEEVENAEKE